MTLTDLANVKEVAYESFQLLQSTALSCRLRNSSTHIQGTFLLHFGVLEKKLFFQNGKNIVKKKYKENHFGKKKKHLKSMQKRFPLF